MGLCDFLPMWYAKTRCDFGCSFVVQYDVLLCCHQVPRAIFDMMLFGILLSSFAVIGYLYARNLLSGFAGVWRRFHICCQRLDANLSQDLEHVTCLWRTKRVRPHRAGNLFTDNRDWTGNSKIRGKETLYCIRSLQVKQRLETLCKFWM